MLAVESYAERPVRILRARRGFGAFDYGELWRYRELFVFLCWRDILIRYKQTYLGVGWAVLQPVLMTVVLTLVFSSLGNFPSGGVPYPVLIFTGLLPWNCFSNALSESSSSLVASARIISKVYFPRLIIPASAALGGAFDGLISLGLLLAMMAFWQMPLRPQLLLLPLFLGQAFLAAFSVGIWLSALNVQYRDVKYLVPFFTRLGLYISPVPFTSQMILERFGHGIHFFYSLNPMVGAIDGFRWAVLGEAFRPDWQGFAVSLAVTGALLISGLAYFRRAEATFADLV